MFPESLWPKIYTLFHLKMYYIIAVFSLALFGPYRVHSSCRTTEFVTREGDCCRYPNPGAFVVKNCTNAQGIRTKNCTTCPNHRIIANCTHFSDTECETRSTPPTILPQSPFVYLAVMVFPVVIGLIVTAALICWFCVQPNSRRSPWIPYLPPSLLTYLWYQKADKNSEATV